MEVKVLKKRIVAIVGPTASGKSALALALAQRLGGEIISCDSMQLYRRMEIGTAKPTREEMALVPHKMIDVVDPEDNFSRADYVKMAKEEIDAVIASGMIPILCGGTGLYLDALLRGSDFESTEVDTALRRSLEEFAKENGNEALHKMLAEIDPESAAAIHQNNVKRVIRAIEIYKTSGKTKSEIDRLSLEVESEYDATVIGLRYNDRELLNQRINQRVDQMISLGLLEETRALESEGIFLKNSTATQAIGYKEMLGYIRGENGLAEAIESLKLATRKYAKRQMTWFSAKKYVTWIDADGEHGIRQLDDIVREAVSLCRLEE